MLPDWRFGRWGSYKLDNTKSKFFILGDKSGKKSLENLRKHQLSAFNKNMFASDLKRVSKE